MKVIEKFFDNEKYYYIGEYKIKSKTIYKFANQKKVIFCTKEDDEFFRITDNKKLKKIQKEFEELKIEDVI